jgi:hypothetical protein
MSRPKSPVETYHIWDERTRAADRSSPDSNDLPGDCESSDDAAETAVTIADPAPADEAASVAAAKATMPTGPLRASDDSSDDDGDAEAADAAADATVAVAKPAHAGQPPDHGVALVEAAEVASEPAVAAIGDEEAHVDKESEAYKKFLAEKHRGTSHLGNVLMQCIDDNDPGAFAAAHDGALFNPQEEEGDDDDEEKAPEDQEEAKEEAASAEALPAAAAAAAATTTTVPAAAAAATTVPAAVAAAAASAAAAAATVPAAAAAATVPAAAAAAAPAVTTADEPKAGQAHA